MGENWKTCNNCDDGECWFDRDELPFEGDCHAWTPMPCKLCGGILSPVRYHNGRTYRHCYACHFEFYDDEEGT